MRNFRSMSLLKLEFFVTLIILAVSVVFSIENREYFVENALEKHYEELSRLSHLHGYLQERKVTEKDLNYTITMLDKLDNPQFILRDDVQLDKALAYKRLGEKKKAEQILIKMISETPDPLSTADGVLQLSLLYKSQEKYRKAAELLENFRKYFHAYRKSEMSFQLADLYQEMGRPDLSAINMVEVESLSRDDNYLYKQVVTQNWTRYSRGDKERILASLIRFQLYSTYADLAKKFVAEFEPEPAYVQDMAMELVLHSYQDYVSDFVQSLKKNEKYLQVYNEMIELHTLAHNEIDSKSARVQGQYYYRKLSYLRKLSRYSDENALAYYNSYLKGPIESHHAALNLEITIRNLLAYKRYAMITNVIERTYIKLGLTNQSDCLADHVSFWNGYCQLILGDTNRAFMEFEHTIAEQPDSYFAIQSKVFITDILKTRKVSVQSYIGQLRQHLRQPLKTRDELMMAKVLYAFVDEAARDKMRSYILDLTEKTLSRNVLFKFDEETLRQFRLDKNYIKFIAYTRYGMSEKARAVLTSSGIHDPSIQEIMLLKELIRNRQFNKAYPMLVSLKQNEFLNNNFTFLNRELKELYYPRPYDAEVNMALTKLAETDNHIDTSLVYAIIRGESMYMHKARSHAGAKGLMQLMPATARLIAGSALGTKEVNLYNPLNNIILGSYYLNDNVRELGLMTAIATYNGGYAVIKKIKKQFHPANELEMMEIHPYSETRHYIKKIMSNYFRYKEIYDRQDLNVHLDKMHLNKV